MLGSGAKQSPNVLVTRPEPGAGATARRLAECGFSPLVVPLTETRAIAGQTPPRSAPDAVAVTSANALRHGDVEVLAALVGVPCFAVGARTADMARETGFANVTAAEGDGQSLARLVGEELPAGARILYLCGRTRRPEFERILASEGYRCEALETYETRALAAQTGSLKGAGAVDCALVYSPNGARALAALAAAPDLAGLFEKTQFLCLSPAVAAALDWPQPERIRVADRPEEDALFRLLPKV